MNEGAGLGGPDGSHNPIEIPESSRDELLDRLSSVVGSQGIRDAFLAAGSSRPVELSRAEVVLLVDVIDSWAHFAGLERLPAGVWDLHNALADDLRHAKGR